MTCRRHIGGPTKSRQSLQRQLLVLFGFAFTYWWSSMNVCGWCLGVVEATQIKWTPAKSNGKDTTSAAATAPKSQKYWDEHGIERPDYAKTDAEVASERRQEQKKQQIHSWYSSGLSWAVVLSLVGVGWYAWELQTKNRLGQQNVGIFRGFYISRKPASAAQLRDARLARFDESIQKHD